jgi:UDP-2,4-diacetamido-2,4,6-trideoxy-beta-L-altropyranose hydrolase
VHLVNVVFRADASLEIGTGHVMRCLTLADALSAQGAECHFICREHPGHLIEHIRAKGLAVHALPCSPDGRNMDDDAPLAHANWLGATQREDAEACAAILRDVHADWLVVDHYALDVRWEEALAPHHRKLMVIDDLADRPHRCDLLLDQTFGRRADDYRPWVPAGCTLLCGSRYALLRPEFAALRSYSLARRESPRLQRLLVTMGGVDKDNATGRVLEALESCALPDDCRITVVMGATAPWLAEVRRQAAQLRWPTEVRVGVSDMARLMADSDLAIGAAGATSWERCCLGLPTVMIVLAENQKTAAMLLEQAQAAVILNLGKNITIRLKKIIEEIKQDKSILKTITEHTENITQGDGFQVVSETLRRLSTQQ